MSDESRSIRVLCVDSYADNAELVAVVLGQAGYQVDLALTGEEGLEMALHKGYAVILLELYLRDAWGKEVCRQIRRFDPDTPILFYTSEAREPFLNDAMLAGAQGCLVKPVDPSRILQS